MTRDEIYEEVTKIFRNVFDDEDLAINNNTNAEDIEDWDSLEQITLLVSMEKKFSIKFDISEISKMKNVGDMIATIEEKLEK